MIKFIFIRRNLALYDEIQKLIIKVQNKHGHGSPVTERFSLDDITARVNSDYRESLKLRTTWKIIRENEVLLTALRDELKRMYHLDDIDSRCGNAS